MSGTRGPAAHPWLRLVAVIIVAALVAWDATQARPPRELTIETGPVGGSYYVAATKYQALLAERGIRLQVKPKTNSLELMQDVTDPAAGVDVGFVAQDLSASRAAPVYMLGQIQLQPVFVFANANLGRRSTIDDLRGRRIVLPPQNSATTAAALRVFQLYDISPENSAFVYAPLAEAVRDLRAGNYDAGAFMLAPENDVVHELINDSGLHLVPTAEARAIAKQLPFLRPVVMPRGIYNIADAIPPEDTTLVAATVGVVVRKGLHPFLVYALLEALTKTHRDAGVLNAADDFPNLLGTQLEPHPLAVAYYRDGIPWTYRDLPPWLASALDRHLLLAAGLLAVIGLLIVATWLADVLAAVLRGLGFLLLGPTARRQVREATVPLPTQPAPGAPARSHPLRLRLAGALLYLGLPAELPPRHSLADRLRGTHAARAPTVPDAAADELRRLPPQGVGR